MFHPPLRASIAVLALLLGLAAGPAAANTVTVQGSLTPGGPTMLVALISTPNCTGLYGAVNVLYEPWPLTVGTSGSYTIEVFHPTTAFYLYQGSFDPAAAADNCYAASNSGDPQTVTVALDPGTQYFVVVIDDTFAQEGADYTLTVDGPGTVLLGDSPLAIPTLSSWGLATLMALLALAGARFVRRRRAA